MTYSLSYFFLGFMVLSVHNGASILCYFYQADCGKHGEYDSPALKSSEEELEDYECIGEVPETSWMVPQVPSPPTASGLHWPRSSQISSDFAVFVPDICHSQMQNPLYSQHNGTVSKRRRQF